MKVKLKRATEKHFDDNGELNSVVHHFSLNDTVEFYLYQTKEGLDIPRTKGNQGIYQFLDTDFKSHVVNMIRSNESESEFDVQSDQIFTDFKPYKNHAYVEATGDLNCYNVLKIADATILRNKDSKLYLQFPKDEKKEFKTDKQYSFQFTSPYDAKKTINHYMMQQIDKRVDMKCLAENYVVLKKTGTSYSGISPFRSERTPSFHVFPKTNTWYDFGTNEGGNAINFLQKQHDYNFSEALECLYAWSKDEKFERKVELNVDVEKRKYGEEAIKKALQFYQDITTLTTSTDSNAAIQYMKKRNISKETCNDFNLSLVDPSIAPKVYSTTGDVIGKFLEAGILFRKEDTSLWFKMEGRVGIPIHNPKGEIVGYNGRQIKENKHSPKYLLSSNSVVFKKSDVLFNYHRAEIEAKNKNCLIVTEGVFDVMRCHEVGIKNSVSLLGSSVSDTHIKLFKELNVPVVLALDNDVAGKKATEVISKRLEDEQIDFVIHNFESGKDLDEALQHNHESNKLIAKIKEFEDVKSIAIQER